MAPKLLPPRMEREAFWEWRRKLGLAEHQYHVQRLASTWLGNHTTDVIPLLGRSHEELYPSTVCTRSQVRGGYQLWDFLLTHEPENRPGPHKHYRGHQPRRPDFLANQFWSDKRFDNERKRYLYSNRYDIDLPFYIDLSVSGDGYYIYEAASVLMHRWADRVAATYLIRNRNRVYSKFLSLALAYIGISLLFRVPIFVGQGTFNKSWMPPPICGMHVAMTNMYDNPVLIMEPAQVMNSNATDHIFGTIGVGVYVQAHPSAPDINDYSMVWAMSPMRMAVIGWEMLDSIVYTPYSRWYADENNLVIPIHPMDLLSPEYLPYAFDELQAIHPSEGSYMLASEWMRSDDFDAAKAEAHPIPFREALKFSKTALNCPMLPQVADNTKLRDFKQQSCALFDLVTRTVVAYENRIYAHNMPDVQREMRRERAARKRRWKSKMVQLGRTVRALVKQGLLIIRRMT